MVAALDTHTLLALPKALSSLSVYQNDCHLIPDSPKQISNVDIQLALNQHQSCIEHLDIYRACTGCLPPVHSPQNSHLGPLRAFERLKSLRIQPEVLLGGCCGDDIATFRLRDTLPRKSHALRR